MRHGTLVTLTVTSLFLPALAFGQQPQRTECASKITEPDEARGDFEGGLVELRPPTQDERNFGRIRQPREAKLRASIAEDTQDLVSAGDVVAIDVGQFETQDGREFPPDQISVTKSEVSSNGRVLEMHVCADPANPRMVQAGAYEGTLFIDDARFQDQAFPLTLNLQERVWWPLLAIPCGAVGGVLWAWSFAQFKGTQTKEELDKRKGTEKLRTELTVSMIVGAGVAVGIFFTDYWADPAWRFDASTWWSLVLKMGAASAAAYPGAAAVGRAIHERIHGKT